MRGKSLCGSPKYEKNGILYFTGRGLPAQEIGKAGFADVMFDLSASNFCVPVN